MELQTLIDAFLASYQGRDPSLLTRLAFWRERLGHQQIQAIDADMVDAEMAQLAARGALKFVRGQGVVSANRPLSPATLNRHLVALGSVLSFARKRRLLPRGHLSAISGVEKMRESEGRLVYLSEEQVEEVIACAAMARWRRLPALIRTAFTTGLRLGALQGLRWRDIDLATGRAFVERTKNGRPHAHLTPATIASGHWTALDDEGQLPGARTPRFRKAKRRLMAAGEIRRRKPERQQSVCCCLRSMPGEQHLEPS